MLGLTLGPLSSPPTLLAVGAHPDDIEIGAGGTLLSLAGAYPGLRAHYVVLSGTGERHLEARQAAEAFLPEAELSMALRDLPDGHMPMVWGEVKDALEEVARRCTPDVIVAPSPRDAHQDHRTIAKILPTVFRDALLLSYEIPKWDGDLDQPNVFVPLSLELAHRKVELLHKCFPSQQGRDWWDDEVFLGLARLRGMECRSRYAEGFSCNKVVLSA